MSGFGDIVKIAAPIAGAYFGGPAGAIAGGSISQMLGAMDANQQNQANAQAQMDFQERMSNTAHQREVSDLRAAGLNPILAVNAGASTPSGAAAQSQNVMEGMAATAREIAFAKMEANKMQADIDLTTNQASAAKSSEALNKSLAEKAKKETEVIDADSNERKVKGAIWKKIYDAGARGAEIFRHPGKMKVPSNIKLKEY